MGPSLRKARGRRRASTRSTRSSGPASAGHAVTVFGVQPQAEAGRDPEPADRDRTAEGLREAGLDLAPQPLRRESPDQREAGAERRRKGQQGEPPSQAHAFALRSSGPVRPRRPAAPSGGGALLASDPNLGFAEPTRIRARRPHLRALTGLVGRRGASHPTDAPRSHLP